MDIGNLTVKEQLEKKMGAEKAGRVLKKLNDAHANGEDLHKTFKDAVESEGHDVKQESSDILYGFFVP